MSSTDELRRLLDERGVEYQVQNDFVTYVFLDDRAITFFTDVVDGKTESVSASVDFPKPVLNGTVWLTPEQAIASTLGSEREKALEELVQLLRDYHDAADGLLAEHDYLLACGLSQRMSALGIEVG